MNDNIKGVLFDLDGTLIDSMAFNFIAWEKSLEFLNLNISLNKKWYFENEGKRVFEIARDLLGERVNNIEIAAPSC